MPCDGTNISPFSVSNRLGIEIQTLCLHGNEEQVVEFLQMVAEIMGSEDLLRAKQGDWKWRNADYESLLKYGVSARPAELGMLQSDSKSSQSSMQSGGKPSKKNK